MSWFPLGGYEFHCDMGFRISNYPARQISRTIIYQLSVLCGGDEMAVACKFEISGPVRHT
jgi:hypothetical protein